MDVIHSIKKALADIEVPLNQVTSTINNYWMTSGGFPFPPKLRAEIEFDSWDDEMNIRFPRHEYHNSKEFGVALELWTNALQRRNTSITW